MKTRPNYFLSNHRNQRVPWYFNIFLRIPLTALFRTLHNKFLHPISLTLNFSLLSSPRMSTELFIGNLNPNTRTRDLENVFGRYGKILRCDLKKNFGFIQYDERRDAETAMMKENDQRLMGSVMTVEWAKGSGPRQGGGGGGGRPGGGNPRYRSPPKGGMRDRSPYGGGRARSPRGGFDRGDRDDRFGGYGGGRRGGGGRDFDDRGPPRDRQRDRGDRFSDARGPPGGDRRGPPRDRQRGGGDRMGRRDSFGSDRRSFGGGPRRF